MRFEWTGTSGLKLYAERGADGIIETTAGPDDLEAHEELLHVVAERDLLRAEKAGAMQAARRKRRKVRKLRKRIEELTAEVVELRGRSGATP